MLAIRIWNGAMAILTFFAVAPYFTGVEAAMARDGLAAASSEGTGRVVVAFGMQGIAMGLYCLWGAVDSRRAVEALRFLTLYMACVSVGRAMAAAGFFSDPTSKPVVYFVLDTTITIIGAVILYRYQKSATAKPAFA
jgi:hypothetical protein